MTQQKFRESQSRWLPVIGWTGIALSIPLLVNCNGAKYDETKKNDSQTASQQKPAEPLGRLKQEQVLNPPPSPSPRPNDGRNRGSNDERRETSTGRTAPTGPSQAGVPSTSGGQVSDPGPMLTTGPSLPDCETCHKGSFTQPTDAVGKSIDLLFVVDTSDSMLTVRTRLAESIDQYMSRLPVGVDVNVGVMAAHGSTSLLSGKLYRSGSEPLVLKSREMTSGDLRSQLLQKLKNASNDKMGSDGGEMGLYSLSKALEPANLVSLQTQGMFRHNATLSVVFVSDEDDICSIDRGSLSGRSITESERKAFMRDCSGVTPETVYQKMRMIKSGVIGQQQAYNGAVQPILLSAIVYNNLSTLEISQVPGKAKHEIGHGYLDIVALNNGQTIDMARPDIGLALNQIAEQTTSKMSLKTEFYLDRGAGAASNGLIRPSSVCALVDGQFVATQFVPSLNQLNLKNAGGPGSKIEVFYCDEKDPSRPEQALRAGQCVTDYVINPGCETLVANMRGARLMIQPVPMPQGSLQNGNVNVGAFGAGSSLPQQNMQEVKKLSAEELRIQKLKADLKLVDEPMDCESGTEASAYYEGFIGSKMLGYICNKVRGGGN